MTAADDHRQWLRPWFVFCVLSFVFRLSYFVFGFFAFCLLPFAFFFQVPSLTLSAERASVGSCVQCFAAMPAESTLRRFARLQARLNVVDAFSGVGILQGRRAP